MRVELGLSQAELARRIGVTRQALHLIETMQVVPSTALALKLARVFNTTVEQLFVDDENVSEWVEVAGARSLEGRHSPLWPELGVGDRVLLVGTDECPLARPAPSGMSALGLSAPMVGVVTDRDEIGQVCVEHAPHSPWQRSLVVAGCDIGLSLLISHAQRNHSRGNSVVWDSADNRHALRLLESSAAQVAALHYPVGAAPAIPDQLGRVERVHFASWQLGWIVRRGNPAGFSTAEALGSGRLRLANRPVGAGTRTLLDRLLREYQVDPDTVPGYDSTLAGHMEVAMAVTSGLADVGIGIASAAAQVGADFLPIQSEVCELLIPQTVLADDGVTTLLDVLSHDRFRWDLGRYGPYDVSRTGSSMVD